jgi:hypothetical protein
MKERVQQLGGNLALDIGKNRTVLQASFPFAQNGQAEVPRNPEQAVSNIISVSLR